jgi:superfamily II DNA or RNA helicase
MALKELSASICNQLSSRQTEQNGIVRVTGPETAMDELRDYLTVENKGIGFQLMRAYKAMKYYAEVADQEKATLGCIQPRTGKMLGENKAIIKELEPKKSVKFFEDIEGEMLMPAGFWFLTGNREQDYHLNTDIPRKVFIPGLRLYQEELVLELLKYKRATGVLATGLGKTRVIAALAVAAAQADKRTFVVVPTDYLVGQLTDTMKEYHDSVTSAGGGRHSKLGTDIFVCTAQSAQKHIGPFDVIIIDESHHSPADTWADLIAAADKSTHIYNLTATAFRADGMDLGIHAFGGPVVYSKSVRWGIANGFLSPLEVNIKEFRFRQPPVRENALATSAYSKMVGNPHVLSWVCEQLQAALGKDKKCILLFKTLKMANKFKKLAKGRVEFSIASAEFKKPLRDFCDGKTQLLVATDRLVSEGIDVKDADVLFLLTENSSDVITYQSVGRVLRIAEGKPKAVVIDVAVTIKEPLSDPRSGNKPALFRQFNNALLKRTIVYNDMTDSIRNLPVAEI